MTETRPIKLTHHLLLCLGRVEGRDRREALYSPESCISGTDNSDLEHLLEKTMAPHSSTLAWKIPWMEEPGRQQSTGSAKSQPRLSDFTFTFHFHVSLSCSGEGNGNPLQCCCLENPRDGGAWWAAIYGVSQSRT